MSYSKLTFMEKLSYYPFSNWIAPASKWEDDEFEDKKEAINDRFFGDFSVYRRNNVFCDK